MNDTSPSGRAPRIHPSILAADFANFERELERISTADAAHVDVMDNHFVPNLTFGQPMVARLQQVSPIPLDLHLMIEAPDRWALEFAELGVWSVTFHAEAATAPATLARRIRERGARAGIALRPGTPLSAVDELLGSFDQLLIMTVEPGFGGQAFMPETMPKLRAARELADRTGLDLHLQVDGGIAEDTIAMAAEHGATSFVAGSAVFRGDPAERIDALRRAAAAHAH
ncbi:ribulose-phosphate 3-epimerase [Pseudoclavibacter endophyticus]|uniref:Ribulose-phosphate 3-epimerase n=1 Tax=Pseudoclavibacter endophyticus TaxID=1778590 RepID=A0A6H9WGL9_9MICO|nr:ribulose-phosphate 3-epimerase [Pseudoclavibacter endophyticus]KAB1650099.1 ribulose-phosphate 3-epimerase [Pseudoclavibacter endophyticus]GGA57224.1 ribulose-phosphate 3-epimerase [Pseudoclavibacter endophyticus]